MTHAQLQELCEYPGLIETQEQLNEIIAHIKSCDGCNDLVRHSLAFDREFFAPLRAVSDRHVRWWQILWLKLTRFRQGSTKPTSRATWHVQTCTVCSAKFKQFSLVIHPLRHPVAAFVSVIIVCFVGIMIWRFSSWRESPNFRGQLQLQLLEPQDGAKINGWQEFKWSAPSSLKEFMLSIENPGNHEVVVQKRVDRPFYSFNADDLSHLVFGKQYEWWVSVQINRKSIESAHRKFFYEEHEGQYTMPENQKREFERIARDGSKEEKKTALNNLHKLLASTAVNSRADVAWLHQTIGHLLILLEDEPDATAELRLSVTAWEAMTVPDSYEYARALVDLGYATEDTGKLQEALLAYQKAEVITRKSTEDSFRRLRGTCLLNLGTLERELGDYDRARADYNEALQLDERLYQEHKLPDRTHVADELHDLGNLYVDEYHDPEGGYDRLRQALDIQQQDPSHLKQRSWPDLLDSIAKVYAVRGQLDKATEWYTQAIALSKHQRHLDGEIQSLNNLVEALINGKKIPLAEQYARKALFIERQAADKVSLDNTWTTQALMGKIYVAEKRYPEAENSLHKSIEMVRSLKNVLPASDWYSFRGARQQPLFDLIILLIDERKIESAFEQLQQFKLETFSESLHINAMESVNIDADTVGLDYVIGLPSDPVIVFIKTSNSLQALHLDTRAAIDDAVRNAVNTLQTNGDAATELNDLAQLLLPTLVREGHYRRTIPPSHNLT